jgi:glycosyltransferase involved in cell wall biosynthesis
VSFSHSFVIPAHNQGQYLAATIQSLIDQDDPCSEIVVSEDYSTDDSLAIAQGYAARFPGKIRVTRPPEHRGMFPNWNWGVGQATTEWVSIMGSDDQALPNFTSTIREGAAKSPNVALIGADWHFMDGEDKLLSSEKVLSLPELLPPPKNFYGQLFANRVHPAAHAFRRTVWEKSGGFPEEIKLWGDWAFWLAAAPHGDFVHMSRTIARYRSNYRPGLVQARLPQTLRDEVAIRLDLIPRLASQFPHVSFGKLRRASRRRFRHVLSRTVDELEGGDRATVTAILDPWAKSLGANGTKLLAKFARGEPIGLGWFDGFVVAPARRLYKRLR